MVKPTAAGAASINQPSSSSVVLSQKQKKRKRKHKQKKIRQQLNKDLRAKNLKFNHTMSAWAENFTAAATWQIKHQLAYWKAKAIAFEYENKILHEIIQNNYQGQPTASNVNNDCDSHQPESHSKDAEDPEELEDAEELEDPEDESGSDFEASEELIQFLAQNAKYKEDARLEREKLKAKLEEEAIEKDVDNEHQETTEDREENSKKLYGAKWQSVMALETSVLTNFISECDKTKPSFWPNIPFNFDFTR